MAITHILLIICALVTWTPGHLGTARAAEVHPTLHVITDANFDDLVDSDSIWMVDVYAPWCTHCRALEPTWRSFAEETKTTGISVGKVDGVQERVLMQRFGVTAYPSIFLLRDGRSWHYEGVRTIAGFKEFAVRGYLDAEPMPFHKCPNSLVGRAMGYLYSVPSLVSRIYTVLKTEHGLSDLTIVVGALAVPVLVGALAICFVDAAYLRKARTGHDHDE